MLVIESARSSRRRDLGFKARLYARYDVLEYWVVDLEAAQVVVHREPGAHGYRRIERCAADAELTPLFTDDVAVAVSDILP